MTAEVHVIEGGGAPPEERGSIYCLACGSHALRLTITADHQPYGVRCFNCGAELDVVWYLDDVEP